MELSAGDRNGSGSPTAITYDDEHQRLSPLSCRQPSLAQLSHCRHAHNYLYSTNSSRISSLLSNNFTSCSNTLTNAPNTHTASDLDYQNSSAVVDGAFDAESRHQHKSQLSSPRKRSSMTDAVSNGEGRKRSLCSQKISFASAACGDGGDKTDFIPDELTFTWIDILATLFSIGSFLFDIGTDIVVATFHYYKGQLNHRNGSIYLSLP